MRVRVRAGQGTERKAVRTGLRGQGRAARAGHLLSKFPGYPLVARWDVREWLGTRKFRECLTKFLVVPQVIWDIPLRKPTIRVRVLVQYHVMCSIAHLIMMRLCKQHVDLIYECILEALLHRLISLVRVLRCQFLLAPVALSFISCTIFQVLAASLECWVVGRWGGPARDLLPNTSVPFS